MIKLYKDCAQYVKRIGRCKKQPDYVTGKAIEYGYGWRGNARLHREDGFISSIIMNSCGKRGRWFEPLTNPHTATP